LARSFPPSLSRLTCMCVYVSVCVCVCNMGAFHVTSVIGFANQYIQTSGRYGHARTSHYILLHSPGAVTRLPLEAARMTLDAVWRLGSAREQVLGNRGKNMCCQHRGTLAWSAPPSVWTTGDADGAEDGSLDRIQSAWLSAVLCVTLEGPLKPDGLSVGAQTHHDGSHTPRSFALCVCARTRAGVVVLVQPARQVIGFARVWSGPQVGCEDVAATPTTHRCGVPVAGRWHGVEYKRERRRGWWKTTWFHPLEKVESGR
jgi:hypothetical protein